MEILNSLSWTIASFVLVLGIMIFVHELGHHLVAKLLGIRVEVFSLGFGPRLFGFKSGDTDYRVSALPLGGYVRMKGESFEEDLTGGEDEFLSRPKTHRFAVAIAGPAMNVVLAIALLAASYTVGIDVPAYLGEPAVIGHVVSESPAEDSGFQVGDEILAVNDEQTPTWEDVYLKVGTSPNQTLTIDVLRDGESIQKVARTAEQDYSGIGLLGVSPPVTNVISSVVEGGPASAAGLEVGDKIVRVDSGEESADSLETIIALIASKEGSSVEFHIQRDEDIFMTTVIPELIDDQVRVGILISPGFPDETRRVKYGIFEAIGRASQRCYQITVLTLQLVGKLLTGETSIKTMAGPIEIAKFSGRAAAEGVTALMGFMSLISLQLGIFNLFPIPILDGGIIALLLVEGILGRDLSLKAKERIFKVGFLFLVFLMSLVIFNDISRNV